MHAPTNLRRLAFSLVPAGFLVLLGEGAARLFASDTALAVGGAMGWTATPGLRDHFVDLPGAQADFSVTTNADGLRTSLGRARTPATRRIVAFGESTIFGWGVADGESPPAQLDELLGDGWEVVNGGQPGYSSEQARRLAEAVVPAYLPDGVLWFLPWNDRVLRAPDRDVLPHHPAELRGRWWARHSALLARLASLRLRRAGEHERRPSADNPLFVFAQAEAAEAEAGTSRVERAHRAENAARAERIAREHGAWMVAVLLPQGGAALDPQAAAGSSAYSRESAEDLAALGIGFVDLEGALAGWDIEAATLPEDASHFTAEANRYLMHRLAQELRRSRRLEGGS